MRAIDRISHCCSRNHQRLPSHELLIESSFYDLDSNEELELSNNQIFSAFYKGAGKTRPDGLLTPMSLLEAAKRSNSMKKAACSIGESQIPAERALLEDLELDFGGSSKARGLFVNRLKG